MRKWISSNTGPLVREDYEERNRVSSFRGYLYKSRRSQNLLAPQWGKRWFSIEGHFLKWYRQESDLCSSGMVDLKYVRNITKLDNHGSHAFLVNAEERNLIVRANTGSEMSQWIRALHMHADIARGGSGTSMIGDMNQIGTKPGSVSANVNTTTGTPNRRNRNTRASLGDELELTLKKLSDLEKEVTGQESEKLSPQALPSNANNTDNHKSRPNPTTNKTPIVQRAIIDHEDFEEYIEEPMTAREYGHSQPTTHTTNNNTNTVITARNNTTKNTNRYYRNESLDDYDGVEEGADLVIRQPKRPGQGGSRGSDTTTGSNNDLRNSREMRTSGGGGAVRRVQHDYEEDPHGHGHDEEDRTMRIIGDSRGRIPAKYNTTGTHTQQPPTQSSSNSNSYNNEDEITQIHRMDSENSIEDIALPTRNGNIRARQSAAAAAAATNSTTTTTSTTSSSTPKTNKPTGSGTGKQYLQTESFDDSPLLQTLHYQNKSSTGNGNTTQATTSQPVRSSNQGIYQQAKQTTITSATTGATGGGGTKKGIRHAQSEESNTSLLHIPSMDQSSFDPEDEEDDAHEAFVIRTVGANHNNKHTTTTAVRNSREHTNHSTNHITSNVRTSKNLKSAWD